MGHSAKSEFDAVVVGGGPAGVVTAIGLLCLGHRVGLVTAPRRFASVEGVSQRACDGLRYCGCHRALATLGAAVPRTAHWNGERSDHNRERIVYRKRFDAALNEDALDAGVVVLGGRVGSMRPWGDGGWLLRLRGAGSALAPQLRAGYLIDARGRGAGGSRKRWSVGPATMSLGGIWRFPPGVPAGTGVASSAEGWVWYALPKEGDAVVQVFVSVQACPLPPRAELPRYYLDLVGRAQEIKGLTERGQPLGAVHARDAGTACCAEIINSNSAKVGDAALRFDPLSGHGLYQAVSGGLALVAVVNTQLRRPGDAALAEAFYRDKLRVDFEHMARAGRDFYRMENRWPDKSFWQERQSWPEDGSVHSPRYPGMHRIERRAVSANGFIVEREVIVTHDHPRGIWRIAGVPLVELLRMLHDRGRIRLTPTSTEVCERLAAQPSAVEVALRWLVSRGLAHRADGVFLPTDRCASLAAEP